MASLIVFSLMNTEALRQSHKLVILVEISLLQRMIRIIIHICDRRITFQRHYTFHIRIQVILLSDPAAFIIIIRDRGVPSCIHSGHFSDIIDLSQKLVGAVIGITDLFVPIRKDHTHTFA